MANNRDITDQITDLPDLFTSAIQNAGVSYHDSTAVMRNLSQTCKTLCRFFERPLTDRMLTSLCHAVIDDDRIQVEKILQAKPALLLAEPPKNLVIESRYTWLKCYAENPLVMAVKCKQVKMIELLLSWHDRLEQTDSVMQARTKAMACWSSCSIQKNLNGEDDIVIPWEYTHYAQSLIEVFSRETFSNGVNGKLSEKTELAISFLFNIILLPTSAVKLDNYPDVELLLLALYRAYNRNFRFFPHWDHRDVFCIRVIGLVQSVLSPETAMNFCEGIYDVVDKGKKISDQARTLTLDYNRPFYRSSRVAQTGLGFDYACGINGLGVTRGRFFYILMQPHLTFQILKSYIRQKQQVFQIFCNNFSHEPTSSFSDRKSRCVIF